LRGYNRKVWPALSKQFRRNDRREAFAVHPAREDKAEAVLDTGAAIGNLGEIVLA